MQTKAAKRYENSPERIKYKREWLKKNYENFVGLRLNREGMFYDINGNQIHLDKDTFLVHKSTTKPVRVFRTITLVHVPRSLCRRARITVNKNTGTIVAQTDKCFPKSK
jgi:hypothetical protein